MEGRKKREIDSGLLIYSNTSDVIKAAEELKTAGYMIRLVSPPPDFTTGCDLAVEFPLIEQVSIERLLKERRNPPDQVLPIVDKTLQPIKICKLKDWGNYIMVRGANMKLTIDKRTLKIVNISGGGCPDVPYLANELVGKTIIEAPSPLKIGYTLCAYTLNIAFEEAKRITARVS